MAGKTRIYYDAATGYLCDRYPKDIPHGEGSPYVEAGEEEALATLSVPYGSFWAVRDGKLRIVEDAETVSTEDYAEYMREAEIASLKAYLGETDYAVAKLSELALAGGEEYEAAKREYAETLKRRKEARARINELEGESE